MATLPGMAERTLTISSGGKTFNTTGWKVGWTGGPPPPVAAARTAKQFLTYVNAAPFQPAIAIGLDLDDDFYAGIAADLTTKRDHLIAGLAGAGFATYVPEATYFTTVDIRPVDPAGDGMAFCKALPQQCGVVAIPNEVFYARPEHGRHLVRFACCKRLDVLDEAARRLQADCALSVCVIVTVVCATGWVLTRQPHHKEDPPDEEACDHRSCRGACPDHGCLRGRR